MAKRKEIIGENVFVATGYVVNTFENAKSGIKAYLFRYGTHYFYEDYNKKQINIVPTTGQILVKTREELPEKNQILKIKGEISTYNGKTYVLEIARKVEGKRNVEKTLIEFLEEQKDKLREEIEKMVDEFNKLQERYQNELREKIGAYNFIVEQLNNLQKEDGQEEKGDE